MSSDLIRYSPEAGLSRRVACGLARLDEQAQLVGAQIETAVGLQAIKADAIGAVAGRALQDIALLSQMEQALAQTVPLASGRLVAIADTAALAMTQVVSETTCRLRRY